MKQEIAGKCQKDSARPDRALRSVAFLYCGILRLESQTDFIDLLSVLDVSLASHACSSSSESCCV